jgi:HD-GYP domain-containing protein (c-di-GMP phosphodiesterase class II)
MIHARLLSRTLTYTLAVGAALTLATLQFGGMAASSTALAVLVIACIGAWWMIARPRFDGATSRQLEQLRHSEAEAQRACDLTLETWARTSEVRGGLGEGYSRRVAALAVMVARELGLDEAAITNVHRGALLHDIGILWVPERVLLKPGPLTLAEREIIERHPTMARDILRNIPFLESALDIPYSHHERWDGQGYPLGLAGEDIPIAARLFAVVDHWVALTTERSYRHAWPKSAALGYLRSSAGTLFEPRMVDAFLRVLERAPRTDR